MGDTNDKNKNNQQYLNQLMSHASVDEEEVVPLLTDNQNLDPDEMPDEIAVLPVRNTVLFPGVVLPITVGREKSINLVKKAYRENKVVGVVAQSNEQNENPTPKDIYEVGTVATILKLLVLPDGNTTIIIQGKQRFALKKITQTEPYFTATYKLLYENFPETLNNKAQALVQSLKDSAEKILKLSPDIPKEAQFALENIESPAFLTHFLSSNIHADVSEKQKLLEINDGIERANALLEHLIKDIHMLELKQEIQSKAHSDLDQQQRDYYLRQQMKVLQEELGQDSTDQQLEDIKAKAAKKNWGEKVQEVFDKEVDRVSRMNPMAPEYPMSINYLEFLVEMPWNEFSQDNFDILKARKILDGDHHGLEKVKSRILEYLAVLKLKNNMKAPILCLYGPPGVGKTSLGKSIAKALGRNYVRMSLGGVRDEAEIRGHRKTYIGAMPGKIIQNLKKSGASNPVFVLDEIDKVGTDFRGDPASALLEVLDPEQNNAFLDNYLDIEYDLSNVMFIATANSLDTIHPALMDRLETIEVTGYTLEEKVQIAKKHLIPKQRKENGLKGKDVSWTEGAIKKLIEGYTLESGVRNLERKVGEVFRKIAKSIAMEENHYKRLKGESIVKLLGPEMFDKDLYQGNDIAGVCPGLAWTPTGGEILYIESSLIKGKGKLTLSGKLGDVMKESASAALTYLKAHNDKLNIDYRIFDNYDIHIHVPAGAVPKDGPSAGITIFTSLASIFTQRKIRERLALSGEITLRGKVLPVGGIKEKVLAAKRAGIREIILCNKNKKDVEEIEPEYIKELKFHYVDHVDEILDIALLDEKVDNPMHFFVNENGKEKEIESEPAAEKEKITM